MLAVAKLKWRNKMNMMEHKHLTTGRLETSKGGRDT